MKNNIPYKKYLFLTIFFLAMMISSVVDATTYYFSTSGKENNSGILPESPWKNLGRIFNMGIQNKIAPGDKFLLKRGDVWKKEFLSAGSYIRLKNQSGTAKAPVIIGAYSKGEKPVLIGVGADKSHTLIRLDDCQHIEVQDLHLIGGQWTRRFFLMSGSATSFVKIMEMEFDNTKENQYNPADPKASRYWGDGVYFTGGSGYHHIEIGKCTFTGIGGFNSTHLNKADAINVSKPLGNFWVHDNKFFRCNEGIDIAGGKDHIVENNLVVETTEFQGIKIHSQHSHVSNSVIRNNVIIKAKSWGLAFENISDCKIYNNTIFDGGYGALFLGDIDGGVYKGTLKKNLIQNNILYGRVGIYGALPVTNVAIVNRFVNNRYYNPKQKALIWGKASKPFITPKNFKEEWLAKSGVSNDTFGNPMFKDTDFSNSSNYGDFRLKSSSPCISGGSRDDIDFSANGTPNIGAY